MNIEDNFLLKLAERGILDITVKGISMYPTLKSGDKVKITKLNRIPCVDDVILFKRANDYVLHRIIYIKDEFVMTKGDNNPYSDIPIHIKHIIGVADGIPKKLLAEPIRDRKITVNIWNPESEDLICKYSSLMNLDVIFCPYAIDRGTINIAVKYEAMTPISQMDFLAWRSENIVFHVGAPISNFPCDGMILNKSFDGIYRSGTYLSSYKMTQAERALILFSEIIAMEEHYAAKNNS